MPSLKPSLKPMTQEQFDVWKASCTVLYAQDKMRANGLTQAEADEVSRRSFADLLPHGLASSGQHLYSLEQDGRQLGIVWLAIRTSGGMLKAFVYDVLIHEAYQGQGHGRTIMTLAEQKARALGARAIGLHVFGFNQRAINLYQSLDYQITDISMEKSLS